jgi:hypothetical protein
LKLGGVGLCRSSIGPRSKRRNGCVCHSISTSTHKATSKARTAISAKASHDPLAKTASAQSLNTTYAKAHHQGGSSTPSSYAYARTNNGWEKAIEPQGFR